MKCVYWNIRGVANASSRLALKRIINKYKPDFLIIAEPKIVFDNFFQLWFARLGFKLFASNSSVIPSIWCLCNVSFTPSLISVSDQFVGFSVCLDNQQMAIAAVYASTNLVKRRELWQDFNVLQGCYPLPWAFFGDFNAIMGAFEHRGRNSPAFRPMADFISWTDCNNLFHFPTTGAKFTWSNKRDPPFLIERRLDRCIGNSIWLDICGSIAVSTLPKVCSDHHPLLLEFHIHSFKVASQFKFLSTWSLHDNCKELIGSVWSQNIVGCPMYVLNKKLQLLKKELKVWNKSVFGNVTENVKYAEDRLSKIQDDIQTEGMCASLKQQELDAQNSLSKALDMEEQFWRDKSRVNWHLEGDRNTAFFHRVTKIKQKFRPISMLRNGDSIITDSKAIADFTVSYFESLFSANLSILQDSKMVEDTIPSLVDDKTKQMLTAIPSVDEISAVVFNLNRNSARAPMVLERCSFRLIGILSSKTCRMR
ncbi:uncharacterized protein LOC131640836 [Vicia villosa]|uniref:uncharacterized protein LOC131640836 n=1 Tax=Vicia villosa TaxID=3911 RepID=UPI00273B8BFA|nr:uncharacterized protein LOC131640836 [Vicia villosa]